MFTASSFPSFSFIFSLFLSEISFFHSSDGSHLNGLLLFKVFEKNIVIINIRNLIIGFRCSPCPLLSSIFSLSSSSFFIFFLIFPSFFFLFQLFPSFFPLSLPLCVSKDSSVCALQLEHRRLSQRSPVSWDQCPPLWLSSSTT